VTQLAKPISTGASVAWRAIVPPPTNNPGGTLHENTDEGFPSDDDATHALYIGASPISSYGLDYFRVLLGPVASPLVDPGTVTGWKARVRHYRQFVGVPTQLWRLWLVKNSTYVDLFTPGTVYWKSDDFDVTTLTVWETTEVDMATEGLQVLSTVPTDLTDLAFVVFAPGAPIPSGNSRTRISTLELELPDPLTATPVYPRRAATVPGPDPAGAAAAHVERASGSTPSVASQGGSAATPVRLGHTYPGV